ncbi:MULTISPECIES: cytochrome P450 [unclassified Mycobacteroides]|uniref:cytochrome P450 n=1 Tax=unclassified Mycobacteroides TaxID=2618759 RepID=UPI0013284221|nr:MULTISPECIES: cytochrome P450 [unclassified Mycobacteroides]MUM16572.1 hypothetical protein [Mycobacteroides sp. CBMA 326]
MTRCGAEPRFLDTVDPEFRFDSDAVGNARRRHWYARTPQAPMVLGLPECYELLRNPGLVQDGPRFMRAHGVESGPFYRWFVATIQNSTGETHYRLRRVLGPLLRCPENGQHDRHIEEVAAKFVEDIPVNSVVDFGFHASRYASAVLCKLLGIAETDFDRFWCLAHDAGQIFAWTDLVSIRARLDQAISELNQFIEELVDIKSRSPSRDVTSALLLASDDAGSAAMTRTELVNALVFMSWAGQQSVARQLTEATRALSAQPEQWDAAGRSAAAAQGAVEEATRWAPQIGMLFRFATTRISFRDLVIPPGTLVLFCPPSAARDARRYVDPDVFDIWRRERNGSLLFGHGIYRCLGSTIAKAELEHGLAALSRRFAAPTWFPECADAVPTAAVNANNCAPAMFQSREGGV